MKRSRSVLKSFAHAVLPPAAFRGLVSALGIGITLRGRYPNWAEASRASAGYDSDLIFEKVQAASLKVKRGEAAFERDSVLFDQIQYSHPVLVGLLRAALSNGGDLSVLDFGGSLGSSYYQNRGLLYQLGRLCWSVVEQERFVAAGRAHFQDEVLKFYYQVDECLEAERPNVALLSSVLQYVEAPDQILDLILSSNIQYVIIDFLPLHAGDEDIITVQRVPPRIYDASYPFRVFAAGQLLDRLQATHEVVLAFDTLELPALRGFNAKYHGYILKRKTDATALQRCALP